MANWRDSNQNTVQAYGASGVTIANTQGGTAEELMVTIPFPAGVLEVGDIIRVQYFGIGTFNSGNNDVRIRIGGHATHTTNSAIAAVSSSNAKSWSRQFDIIVNSSTTCIAFPLADPDAQGASINTATTVSSNFDITADINLYISSIVGDVLNTHELKGYTVDLIKAL